MKKILKFNHSRDSKKEQDPENDEPNEKTKQPQHTQICSVETENVDMNSAKCSNPPSQGPFYRKFLKKSNSNKSLSQIIKKKRWRKVSKLLFSKEWDVEQLVAAVEKETGLDCLSLVCMMQPPIRIVIKIVDVSPILVLRKNSENRSPLHFAAGWGASPHVVSLLTAMNPEAASSKDKYGKTPLILACEHMHPMRLSDTGNIFNDSISGPTIEVIEALVVAAPHVVADEDCKGLDALSYLKNSSVSKPIFKYLKESKYLDVRVRGEDISERGKQRYYEKVKKRIKPGCTTIWDNVNLTNKEEREMHKKISNFLSIEDEIEMEELSLEILDKFYPHALYAAEHGFVASLSLKQYSLVPSIIEISCRQENVSDCTMASYGSCLSTS